MNSLGGSDRLVALRFVRLILNAESCQIVRLWDVIENELRKFFPDSVQLAKSSRKGWPDIIRNAESLEQAGVYIITMEYLESIGRTNVTEPCFMFAKGPADFLEYSTASILNSRKPKRVNPDDDWLRKTRVAINEAIRRKSALVSSLGSIQYDVVTAAFKGHNLILVCESLSPIIDITFSNTLFFDQYSDILDQENTLFLCPSFQDQQPSKHASAFLRDRVVGALSDEIYEIDIRPGGNMSRILREAHNRNVPIRKIGLNLMAVTQPDRILNAAQTVISSSFEADRQEDDMSTLGREIRLKKFFSLVLKAWVVSASDELQWLDSVDEALFHYTRSCHGKWPGQGYNEYLKSLLSGSPESSHSAFDTILRIASEGRIRASGSMIRGKFPVVSFTEVPPNELGKIRIWRTGVYRWTLEPYGIAIKRKTLSIKGGRQVKYGSLKTYESLPDGEKYLFQILNTEKYDWSIEKEWRIKGDLHINELPVNDWAFVLPTQNEADTMFNLMSPEPGHRKNISRTLPCSSTKRR